MTGFPGFAINDRRKWFRASGWEGLEVRIGPEQVDPHDLPRHLCGLATRQELVSAHGPRLTEHVASLLEGPPLGFDLLNRSNRIGRLLSPGRRVATERSPDRTFCLMKRN